ncbi:MAG: hypothetical protein IT343_01030 [Candidatus Melainabacteria bacterium]|nr:hypothetical protein [Candidatus Melainabacteria bacterium]
MIRMHRQIAKSTSCALSLMFFLSSSLADCRPVFAQAKASSDKQQFLNDVRKCMIADNWSECDAASELYLRKHKDDGLGQAVKAYVLMQQGRDKDAVPHFNAAIKGDVTSLPGELALAHANNLWSWRGYSLMRSGKFQEGIKDVEKSLELKPRTCLDLLNQRIDCKNIAAAYRKLGDMGRSTSYENAGDLKKQQYHHVFYPPLKSPAEAKSNAASAMEEMKADPKSTIALCKYGAMQIKLKNWQEALKYLDKAIAVEPYLMPARLLRALALKKLNRTADAQKDLAEIQKNSKRAGINVWAVDQKELGEVSRL